MSIDRPWELPEIVAAVSRAPSPLPEEVLDLVPRHYESLINELHERAARTSATEAA